MAREERSTPRRDALAVLLPAIDDLAPDEAMLAAFADGCCGLLLAGTGEEFVARRMSDARIARERPEDVAALRAELDARAGGAAFLALDVEPGGLERLHRLVPALDADGDVAAVEARAETVARAMAALGANVALGPIADVVTGPNPWLDGRHLGPDPVRVGAVCAAVVRGLERGGVAAVVKHFPGHPVLPDDPGQGIATMRLGRDDLDTVALPPFREAIRAGAAGMMVGPAIVDALDPERPSTLSAPTLDLLRSLGFRGLAMGECLNDLAPCTGGDIGEAAIAAIAAGCDQAIVFGDAGLLRTTAEAVERAAVDGRLDAGRLADAAARVRGLAGTRV